jgi:uncharacterized BrkB/YihY/UPF0761 family membrane protein
MRTEVHVFAFSIAASVLLSLFPFLNVMVSLCTYGFRWHGAYNTVYGAIGEYFGSDLGRILRNNLYLHFPARIEIFSVILLLFTANGIFEPLEVSLNRAWGVTKDRSYVKNQLLSFGLIMICGALALSSFMFTAMNTAYLQRLLGPGFPIPSWISVALFRLSSIPTISMALFLTYWLLPNCRVPALRVAKAAAVVGLALVALQFVAVLSWKWLMVKLAHDYGPFNDSCGIILFSFLAAMIVLAGAEWSARQP